jgi:hypothetical protein
VPLDLHAEALGSTDVDVVLRQVHAVARFISAQGLDRREDGRHSRLVLDLLQQLLADQKRWVLVRSVVAFIVGSLLDHSALDGVA